MINTQLLSHHPLSRVSAADPEKLLSDAVRRLRKPALREFLTTVVHEPEIHEALTTATPASMASPAMARCYPIQILDRAGDAAACWCDHGGKERDVLWVATLLQGTQELLRSVVQRGSSVEDVMFTLVRKPLHRLDDHAPRCARLLRLALGWGCADESDDFDALRLRMAVQRALTRAGCRPAVPCAPERRAARRILSSCAGFAHSSVSGRARHESLHPTHFRRTHNPNKEQS